MMIAALMLSALTSSCAAMPPPSSGALNPKTLTSFVDQFVAAEQSEHRIPGVAFVLVTEEGVLVTRAYGVADREQGIVVDAERTVFRVGSLSKTLTAVALMQLVEQGWIGLEEDVSAYLAEGMVPDLWNEPVTLFHLLTHTAGFDESFLGQHAEHQEDWQRLSPFLAAHLTRRRLPPGRIISYNDYGTSLAGLVLESVAEQDFAGYVQDHIFEPLGMTRSTFAQVDLPETIRANLAKAYVEIGGELRPCARDYVNTTPAAGLFTTAADMGRFLRALVQGGGQGAESILTETSVNELLRRQFSHVPELPGRGFGFAETLQNGRLAMHKDGQCSGFNARLVVLPQEKVAWFSVSNRSIFDVGFRRNGAIGFHRRLGKALLERFFPALSNAANPPAESVAPLDPDTVDLNRFLGVYRDVTNPRDSLETAFMVDEVQVTLHEEGLSLFGVGPWVPSRPLVFQYPAGGSNHVAFQENGSGRVKFLLVGSGAYERQAWYQVQSFQQRAGLILGGLVGSAVLVWLAAAALRLRRRTGKSKPGSCPGAGWAFLVALLLVGFATCLGLIGLRSDPQKLLFHAAPASLVLVLTLPIVAGSLILPLAWKLGQSWRHRQGSLLSRIYYTLVGLGGLATLTLLHSMNLLGF